jgi:hypothetical protein
VAQGKDRRSADLEDGSSPGGVGFKRCGWLLLRSVRRGRADRRRIGREFVTVARRRNLDAESDVKRVGFARPKSFLAAAESKIF